MVKRYSRVLIGPKIDLDTIATGFILGVTREDSVEVVRSGQASEADLADPSVHCIEVGGSGRVDEECYDHHEAGGPTSAASRQAHESVWGAIYAPDIPELHVRNRFSFWLGEYVHIMETYGPKPFRAARAKAGRLATDAPYLTDIIAGMLLTERDPVEQFHRGIEVLRRLEKALAAGEWNLEVIPTEEDFPGGRVVPLFGRILLPEFARYAEVKAADNRQRFLAVGRASWGTTRTGRKVAWVESTYFGALGALYARGAEVVVAFNQSFGNPPVRKFTIGGNNVEVSGCLERLNALESGWGGSATGTILGSRREGSSLTLEEVVEVVRETL